MKPGDLVFWEDGRFGRHRLWKIESVLLAGEGHESLVRIVSLSHEPGADEDGNYATSLLVPECLVRGMIYTIEGDLEPDREKVRVPYGFKRGEVIYERDPRFPRERGQ